MNKKLFKLFLVLICICLILWLARVMLFMYLNKRAENALNVFEYNVIKEV